MLIKVGGSHHRKFCNVYSQFVMNKSKAFLITCSENLLFQIIKHKQFIHLPKGQRTVTDASHHEIKVALFDIFSLFVAILIIADFFLSFGSDL